LEVVAASIHRNRMGTVVSGYGIGQKAEIHFVVPGERSGRWISFGVVYGRVIEWAKRRWNVYGGRAGWMMDLGCLFHRDSSSRNSSQVGTRGILVGQGFR
jgi:hypothetical protein